MRRIALCAVGLMVAVVGFAPLAGATEAAPSARIEYFNVGGLKVPRPAGPTGEAVLAATGTISGTVTNLSATPLAGITVTAHTTAGPVTDVTDGAGAYSLTVDPGAMLVEFTDPTGTYASEFWNDALLVDATPISVSSGGAVSGIDAQLAAGAKFTGKLKEVGGSPAVGVDVLAIAVNGTTPLGSFKAVTDASGNYSIAGLPAATYIVAFSPTLQPGTLGRFPFGFYPAATVDTAATKLTMTAGQTRALNDSTIDRVQRLAGADRYGTAIAISQRLATSSFAVYVATGANYPDALAASAAAGQYGYPILLTSATSLSSATRAELVRLKPSIVYVVGGTGVVGDTVVAQISGALPSATITRLAGSDRYGTAAAVSADLGYSADPVYLATGTNYPDALAGASAAAHRHAPILLASATDIPGTIRSQLSAINPSEVVLLGGTGVIPSGIATTAANYGTGVVRRLGGADRYATAALISQDTYADASLVVIAVGTNFPDALAGGPLAGAYGAPILLVQQNGIPSQTKAELTRLKPEMIVILGGTGAVSASVESQLQAYVP